MKDESNSLMSQRKKSAGDRVARVRRGQLPPGLPDFAVKLFSWRQRKCAVATPLPHHRHD